MDTAPVRTNVYQQVGLSISILVFYSVIINIFFGHPTYWRTLFSSSKKPSINGSLKSMQPKRKWSINGIYRYIVKCIVTSRIYYYYKRYIIHQNNHQRYRDKSSTNSGLIITEIPKEVVLEIIHFLNPYEVIQVAQTNKLMNRLCNHVFVWKNLEKMLLNQVTSKFPSILNTSLTQIALEDSIGQQLDTRRLIKIIKFQQSVEKIVHNNSISNHKNFDEPSKPKSDRLLESSTLITSEYKCEYFKLIQLLLQLIALQGELPVIIHQNVYELQEFLHVHPGKIDINNTHIKYSI